MEKEQKQIEEFMDKAGKTYPKNGPEIPPEEMRRFRLEFILEEFTELAKANGYNFDYNLTRNLDHELDEIENADGLADIIYVTKGMATSYGVDLDPIFQLVHDANMKKFGPGGYLSVTGKWIKPPDWKKPDIATELQRQRDVAKTADLQKVARWFGVPLEGEELSEPTEEEYQAHYAYLESCGENDRPPKDRVWISNPNVVVELLQDSDMEYIVRHVPENDDSDSSSKNSPLGKLTSDTQKFEDAAMEERAGASGAAFDKAFRPLGVLTQDLAEFEKSMKENNARVIGANCFTTSSSTLKIISEAPSRFNTDPAYEEEHGILLDQTPPEEIERLRGEDHAL